MVSVGDNSTIDGGPELIVRRTGSKVLPWSLNGLPHYGVYASAREVVIGDN